MRFLVDAHLSRGLCAVLERHRHDATHTLDLPAKNATKDRVVNQISLDDQRVVISKDTDFFYSHLLQGRPWKLVLVKTGNISTRDLRALFERNLPAIESESTLSSMKPWAPFPSLSCLSAWMKRVCATRRFSPDGFSFLCPSFPPPTPSYIGRRTT